MSWVTEGDEIVVYPRLVFLGIVEVEVLGLDAFLWEGASLNLDMSLRKRSSWRSVMPQMTTVP